MTSQSTIYCTILFFVLSQKVLIAQMRLNVLLGDINKVFLIKTILIQLKPI